MPSLERTAYPRFGRVITSRELESVYTPSGEERAWAASKVRTPDHLLSLTVLLKCFQRLHYFPSLELTPEIIITHVRQCLQLANTVRAAYDRQKTMYRHQQLIREWLEIEPYYGNRKARALAAGTALRIAAVIDDSVDIVNAMLGELQRERIELPAYSTLDRLADRAHAAADHRLFSWVMRHLVEDLRKKLSDLLLVDTDQKLSAFQAVKASAKNATLSHLEERLNHLQWLESLGQMDQILAGIPPAKIRSFAQEAKALDIAELKDYREPQRLTLMLCLVQRARVRTRDDIAEMFLRRMTAVHRRAKEELQKIQLEQRQRTEKLIETLDSMLAVLYSQEDALAAAFEIKSLVGDKKRIEDLRVECAAIRAWSKNNYLPLLWNHCRSHRQALLKVLRSLRLGTAAADDFPPESN